MVQFYRWEGKSAVLAWLEHYLERVLLAFNSVTLMPSTTQHSKSWARTQIRSDALPWASLTTCDLMSVYASQTWDGQLDVNEFARVLQRLLGLNSPEGSSLATRLFPALDRDASGLLDFQEVFIGMAMLCSDTEHDRLRSVFEIMDADNSGRISMSELQQFLVAIAPWMTTRSEIQAIAAQVMREADDNNSGYITFMEVSNFDVVAV